MIPDGYHSVNAYLVVADVPALIEFTRRAFGAVEKERMLRPDGVVAHAEVTIGDSTVMLGTAPAEADRTTTTLYLYVADVDAVYRQAVAAGATTIREPADEFYGDRVAGVRDGFGTSWWIATHVEDVSPAELERRAREQHAAAH